MLVDGTEPSQLDPQLEAAVRQLELRGSEHRPSSSRQPAWPAASEIAVAIPPDGERLVLVDGEERERLDGALAAAAASSSGGVASGTGRSSSVPSGAPANGGRWLSIHSDR